MCLFPEAPAAGFYEVDSDLLHILAVMAHKSALSCSSFPEFQEVLPGTLPILVRMLNLVSGRSSEEEQASRPQRGFSEVETNIVYELLCTFDACGAFLNGYVHIVLPALARLASTTSVNPQTRVSTCVSRAL